MYACGFAPGISNMLTMYAVDSLSKAEEIRIKVGGLPQQPRPPLNYIVTFSIEDLIEEYLCPARIVQNGKLTKIQALTGVDTRQVNLGNMAEKRFKGNEINCARNSKEEST